MTPEARRALCTEFDDLQAAYAQCLDDDAIEAWPDFFVEKGIYQIVPRENEDLSLPIAILSCEGHGMLRDRVFSLRKANIYRAHWYRHLLGRSQWRGSEADGSHRFQTNYAVLRTLERGPTEVFSAGRYLDRVIKVGDAFRYLEKRVIFDNTWIDTLLVTPL